MTPRTVTVVAVGRDRADALDLASSCGLARFGGIALDGRGEQPTRFQAGRDGRAVPADALPGAGRSRLDARQALASALRGTDVILLVTAPGGADGIAAVRLLHEVAGEVRALIVGVRMPGRDDESHAELTELREAADVLVVVRERGLVGDLTSWLVR